MPGEIKGPDGRVSVRRDVADIIRHGVTLPCLLMMDDHGIEGRAGRDRWTQVRYWARREGLTEEG